MKMLPIAQEMPVTEGAEPNPLMMRRQINNPTSPDMHSIRCLKCGSMNQEMNTLTMLSAC